MNVSIVIPTYNRKPILEKCLYALENQKLNKTIKDYEIIIVDDGSTDGTTIWIRDNKSQLPHVVLYEQKHGGPALGRNLGVMKAKNEIIIFIDSDLIVKDDFIQKHVDKLIWEWERNNKKCFTYGSVVNTSNFQSPEKENYKITDISFAYFATGNVAISKELILQVGLFDTSFSLYGWEDLELGERLKIIGTKLIKCPEAVGFHWHPEFTCDQIEPLIEKEKERAKMALLFLKKHPNLRVRFIIQHTILHKMLWEILCLGGLLNINNLRPLLNSLVNSGKNRIALEILRIPLNYIYVKELYKLNRISKFS
tara:strand:+ start:8097 stop:9026 length:930 start_codon:yes stop_codon:yes gene_type:complete